MIGMFNEPNKKLTLNEGQNEHSDPPLEGVDFSEFKEGLGNYSMAGGFSPYPINMIDYDQDVFLHMDRDNCAHYRQVQDKVLNSEDFANIEKEFSQTLYPELTKIASEEVTTFE